MKEYGVYFMIHSIDVVRGGMTRAALIRASMLREVYSHIGIITFDFNPNYERILNKLAQLGLWHENMYHYNVYEFFMVDHVKGLNNLQNSQSERTENSNLTNVRQTKTYDQEGRLRKLSMLDQETNHVVEEKFFSPNGSCFFKRSFHPVTKKTLKCTSYAPNGKAKKSFQKVKDYRNYFIHSIAENHEAVVLLSDGRFSDKILFAADHPKIAKVALLHSNHLQFPYHYGSPLVKRNENLIRLLNKLDAFVTLTERQAKDIRSRFGQVSTVHVIGHPAPAPQSIQPSYEPYTAVIVARYEGIKQIPHAIKAFKKVVKRVPQARLEIWGFGKYEEQYKRLITRLKLKDHVFIKGFSHHIEEVFKRAAFSVITSKSEAFAMAIVESMSVGTPVICYACDYGPTDLIEHEKSGVLIAPNEINSLARAMIGLFLNKPKRQNLSKEAVKIIKRYNEKVMSEKWVRVFEQAIKQKNQRIRLTQMSAVLTGMYFLKSKQSLSIKGELYLKENRIPRHLRKYVVLSLQVRKRKELEDVYVQLQFRWQSEDRLYFEGRVDNIEEIQTGLWDVNLSFACLNASQFIQLRSPDSVSFESIMQRARKALFRLYINGESVSLRVYRSSAKEKFNVERFVKQLIEKTKMQIRQQLKK